MEQDEPMSQKSLFGLGGENNCMKMFPYVWQTQWHAKSKNGGCTHLVIYTYLNVPGIGGAIAGVVVPRALVHCSCGSHVLFRWDPCGTCVLFKRGPHGTHVLFRRDPRKAAVLSNEPLYLKKIIFLPLNFVYYIHM